MQLTRQPDRIIGDNYLYRWYVIPRNRFLNIYLHKFIASDDDRALHDHPWLSVSFLLKGEMIEHLLSQKRHVPVFIPVFRLAKHAHRLEVVKSPVWTVFITGPNIRQWGFLCPKGWVHWSKFTDSSGNSVGVGCGEE